MNCFTFIRFLGTILVLAVSFISAQNRFDGYSLDVSADRAGNGGACPVRYLSQNNEMNHIQVFLAGTNLRTPATGLTGCDNSKVQGNRVAPSPYDQKWCFQGPEELYEIKLSNGNSYLWPMIGRETGFYNLKDFRPVRRVEGPTPKYTYSDPPDYTRAFRNAMMIMASRRGGTLIVPDGDYIVGTTDGNTRDPSYDAITIPAGVNIIGAGGISSVPSTNLIYRHSAARIRLRNNNQTIFRIGGCTTNISVRNLELLGNAALYGEPRRDRTGTYGIEAVGKWAIDPVTKAHTANSSLHFTFDNLVFQAFDTGIIVQNANPGTCKATEQLCYSWQFDLVRVNNSAFINNATGISIDTANTDWIVSSSTFNYLAAEAPGIGIHLKRGGAFLMESTFGGGYDYGASIGGTFLYIDNYSIVTIINSSSESSQRSIFAAGYGAISNMTLTLLGNNFSDKIELGGRMNFSSTGNIYAGYTMETGPNVTVNSVGDKFCVDPTIGPGLCLDKPVSGNAVNDPGFKGGKVMFRSGRLPEGSGQFRLNRQPNLFGYDVEINSGLLQHDPNTTFKDINALAAAVETGSRVKDGAIVYCKDCKKTSGGLCTQGQAGTDGAFAKRINNQWRCD